MNIAMILCVACLCGSMAFACFGRFYHLRMVKLAIHKDVDGFAIAHENFARCILATIALFMLSSGFAVTHQLVPNNTDSTEVRSSEHTDERVVSVP